MVKAPAGHNHLAVITGHIPWFGCNEGIHRCAFLHALAKSNQSLRCTQLERLNNIRAGSFDAGDAS